ncbi:MAG TPA: hypothetical protein VK524_30645 [Polyangiaceae bacterium]|nr:hypothetical protein [Polyangiaceae bacterium]
MKPGDHPDFFRLPPPPGRSRESSIRLDGVGKFWHDGEPVAHPGMARAFASWIARHPDDGRFILSNGYDWSYFSVDDVPFFVLTLQVAGEDVSVLLSDGSEEPLAADTLQVGSQDALYVRVKGGSFEARFTPAAQAALAPLLVEGPNGEPVLEIAGKRYSIRERSLH